MILCSMIPAGQTFLYIMSCAIHVLSTGGLFSTLIHTYCNWGARPKHFCYSCGRFYCNFDSKYLL